MIVASDRLYLNEAIFDAITFGNVLLDVKPTM